MIAQKILFTIVIALSATTLFTQGAAIVPVNQNLVAVERDIPIDYAVVAQFQSRAMKIIGRSDNKNIEFKSDTSEVQRPIRKSACHDTHGHHKHLDQHGDDAGSASDNIDDKNGTVTTDGSNLSSNEGYVGTATATTTMVTAATVTPTSSGDVDGANATATSTGALSDLNESSDSAAATTRNGVAMGLVGFAVASLLM
ncbi:hypothetical protein BGZ76_007322 [Entomortierella beljakovae]|nr:hypothetical protein BGZ76_007322 [Entomortierella beljakovae]